MRGAAIDVITTDGTALRGISWLGSAPAVLLIHEPGTERDLDDWRPLLPYLLGDGAMIVALDLRGHGASDGEWDPAHAANDLATAVAWTRQSAAGVVVCAAGASSAATLRAAERCEIDGIVLFSPDHVDAPDLRGAGVPKLLFAGAHSRDALATVNRLRTISIGPAISASLPVAEQGTALLASEAAAHVREHLLRFLRERRRELNGESKGDRRAPDLALERLGIAPKGVTE